MKRLNLLMAWLLPCLFVTIVNAQNGPFAMTIEQPGLCSALGSVTFQHESPIDHSKSESDFYRQEIKELYAKGKLEFYKYGEPLIKTD